MDLNSIDLPTVDTSDISSDNTVKDVNLKDIAVIGVSLKFPMANSLEEYENILSNGIECIQNFPSKRKDFANKYLGLKNIKKDHLNYSIGGYLNDINEFDHEFFGIPPKEASLMDPHQRLFLQTAWQAIDDAGYGGEKLKNTNTGVYMGYTGSTEIFDYKQVITDVDYSFMSMALPGNLASLMPSRISYLLNLKGPSLLVDTACSSSLVSIHLACKGIQNNDCGYAIAGGARLTLFPLKNYGNVGIESSNGRTRTFDESADGTGLGEGVAAVLLKPLHKALEDGDDIYGVIKGSAINQDGASAGITAPNVIAQEKVMLKAWQDSNIDPQTITYLEAHGTGTKLGDPIEFQSINKAFSHFTDNKDFCGIGSVKTNLGHLHASAGIAGFIKCLLSLKTKKLYPTINFEKLNSKINRNNSSIYINNKIQKWKKTDQPRRCGINSFGFSGTNCHVVLEEAPEREIPEIKEEIPQVFVLSAKSKDGLLKYIGALLDRQNEIITDNSISLGDVCYTLQTGRNHSTHRLSFICNSKEELFNTLASIKMSNYDSYMGKQISELKESDKETMESDIQALIENASSKEIELEKIAHAYLQGKNINWKQFNQNNNFQNIHLPTFPFSYTSCEIQIPESLGTHEFFETTQVSSVAQNALVTEIVKEVVEVQLLGKDNNTYTDEERKIGQIWGEVLGYSEINIEKNFFNLGGESIALMQILQRINAFYNINIQMQDFVKNASIQQLAQLISENDNLGTNIVYKQLNPDYTNIYEPFGLTDIQAAYLVGRDSNFELGGIGTHIYSEIETKLVIQKLSIALQKVIARHPMLRTIFINGAQQQILENVPAYEIKQVDISSYSATEQKLKIEAERERMSHFVFDPSKWPLFELTAFKLSYNTNYLFFGYDMLIADGLSLMIFQREVLQYYHNENLILPTLDVNFRDYIIAYEEFKNSDHYLADKKFHLNRIDELPYGPQLPLKKAVASVEKPVFKHKQKTFSQENWSKLKDFARQMQVTPTALICSAYARMLNFWSNEDRFTINLTVFNRYPFHEQINQIIGDFTSVILLDVNMEAGNTLETDIKNIQDKMMECLEHRHFDGVGILRELARRNNTGAKAIMPVVFTSMLFDDQTDDFGGLNSVGEIMHSVSQTSQVYLDNQIREVNKELTISWDYVDELFDEQVIDTMFNQYISILQRIIDELPEQKLAISNSDKEFVEKYNNSSERIEVEPLHKLFEKQVAQTPSKVAVVSPDGTSITFADLNKKANQIANFLIKKGVVPEDCLGVFTHRSLVTITNMLGILKAGATYVPMEPDYPKDRTEYILENCSSKIVLNQETYEKENVSSFSDSNIELNIDLKDKLAYIIYTSGSTGKPKGVMIKHEAAANTIIDINNKFKVTENDNIIGLSSMCFDLSVYDIFGALSTGASLYIIEDLKNTDKVVETLLNANITFWNSVPSVMNLLVENISINEEYKNKQFNSLKNVLLSGDWIPVYLPSKIGKFFPETEVISLGGATEASIWSIYYPINEVKSDWSSIPYGMPLANQTIYVLRENLEICPVGVQGELFIGGDGVASGYMNDLEKTAHAFIDHPELGYIYRTGDYGILHKEGHIEFLGRRDAQVKVRGHRIELGEIESVLAASPYVRDAIVMAKEGAERDKKIIAYVTPNNQLPWDYSENNRMLDARSRIPRINFTDNIKYSSEGKEYTLSARDLSPNLATVKHLPEITGKEGDVEFALKGMSETLKLKARYVALSADTAIVYFSDSDEQKQILSSTINTIDQQENIKLNTIADSWSLSASANLKIENENIKTEIKLLDNDGICLTGAASNLNAGAIVTIEFGFDEQNLKIRINGEVKWINNETFGVAFVKASENDQIALNIVRNYSSICALSQSYLRNFLEEKVPEYMIPFAFVVLNQLPLTTNAKIDRKRLPEPEMKSAGEGEETFEPRNEIEVKILEMWKEILNLDQISINANFFELGGDSLQVYQIAMKAEAEYGIKIPVDSLYKEPTIANISEFIAELQEKAGGFVQSNATSSTFETTSNTEELYYWSPSIHWNIQDDLVLINEQLYNVKPLFPKVYFLAQNGITFENLKAEFTEIPSDELDKYLSMLVKDNVLITSLSDWHTIFKPQQNLFNNKYDKDLLFNKDKYKEYKNEQMNRDFNSELNESIELDVNHDLLPDTITKRRSFRNFNEEEAISQKNLSDLLSVFRQYKDAEGNYRYYYASSGTLYPIDIYFYVKENRVENLKQGLYYYNPANHKINLLSTEPITEKSAYIKNKEIFRSSAITMYMIYNANASMPVYGGDGYFYATLDAGIMISTLTHAAELMNIGLCSIGDMNFDVVKDQFNLDPNQLHIHTIELGYKPDQMMSYEEVIQEYERNKEEYE